MWLDLLNLVIRFKINMLVEYFSGTNIPRGKWGKDGWGLSKHLDQHCRNRRNIQSGKKIGLSSQLEKTSI